MILMMFDFLKRFFFPTVFEVCLNNGNADISRGKATKAFIQDCLEICKQQKLDRIIIYGVSSEYGVRLEFSSNTPESCRQMFRNIWEIYK